EKRRRLSSVLQNNLALRLSFTSLTTSRIVLHILSIYHPRNLANLSKCSNKYSHPESHRAQPSTFQRLAYFYNSNLSSSSSSSSINNRCQIFWEVVTTRV